MKFTSILFALVASVYLIDSTIAMPATGTVAISDLPDAQLENTVTIAESAELPDAHVQLEKRGRRSRRRRRKQRRQRRKKRRQRRRRKIGRKLKKFGKSKFGKVLGGIAAVASGGGLIYAAVHAGKAIKKHT
jgi:hypothetical protein